MTLKEQVVEEIETLNESQLEEVARYLAFLKSRGGAHALDEKELAALYAEFAEEDRGLAEEGLADYVEGLREEDGR